MSPEAKQALRKLVLKHEGNIAKIAKAEKLTRQGASMKLQRAGFDGLAATQRLKAGRKPGQRYPAEGEKDRIVKVLKKAKDRAEAVKLSGMSRSAFYRRLEAYNL